MERTKRQYLPVEVLNSALLAEFSNTSGLLMALKSSYFDVFRPYSHLRSTVCRFGMGLAAYTLTELDKS